MVKERSIFDQQLLLQAYKERIEVEIMAIDNKEDDDEENRGIVSIYGFVDNIDVAKQLVKITHKKGSHLLRYNDILDVVLKKQ